MRKSFASILQSTPDSACHQFVAKKPFLHRGEPSLTIAADEEASLAKPFKFTLVGVPLRIDEATVDLLRPITAMIPKSTVDPAPMPVVVELPIAVEIPLVDRTGNGKGNEAVVETRKQWVPLASSSSIPPPISKPPAVVIERHTSEHILPVTNVMASKPIIADTTFDPLLNQMISLPREYPMLSESIQSVFDHVPHTHPDPRCHENVEASLPSDNASSIQLGGHKQGHFRRNLSEDLVGLGERQESDGFTTVQRKKSSKGIDIPRPSKRVTRSQTSASSHSQSL
ncbi:Uncharacterized protein Adt_19008 [Abeliophyllum distichum]|uniref:Uncharacterized protein n=1 Tax=Abeliophyllum distichum TaxID=126358 RepID=A0ABD1TLG8_9LAMI